MTGRFHRAADEVATGAFRVPRLYGDGFGNLRVLERIVEQIRDYDPGIAAPPLRIHWGRPRRFGPGTRRSGWFLSPTLHIPLPPESRRAYLEEIVPRGDVKAVVLHLAATGEVGFLTRRYLARSLLRLGYASVLLENPFYGRRKPQGQHHAAIRTVAEQFAMNFATVEEGRALLSHLYRHRTGPVAVTGYSQGGVMAAFSAALCRYPVAVSPRGAADSVADLFTRDSFSRVIRWDRLTRDAGSEEAARALFRRALQVVTVSRFPPPVRSDAAVILAGRYDRFITPSQPDSLQRHWPGAELRWLNAGHVTGIVLHLPAHVRTIRDSLERLQAGAQRLKFRG